MISIDVKLTTNNIHCILSPSTTAGGQRAGPTVLNRECVDGLIQHAGSLNQASTRGAWWCEQEPSRFRVVSPCHTPSVIRVVLKRGFHTREGLLVNGTYGLSLTVLRRVCSTQGLRDWSVYSTVLWQNSLLEFLQN